MEFQQLVYNSPTMLRPRRFAVQGEQAILQQLRELNGHEPLVRDTERLFRGTLPDGAYIVRDGRWFPELMPDKVAQPEPEPAAAEQAAHASLAGQKILEEVARRMVSLEATVQELSAKLESALEKLATAAASGALASVQARTEHAPTMAMPHVPGIAGAVTAPSAGSPAAHAAPGGATSTQAGSASDKKSITLPTMSALTDLMRGLAGPDANLAPSERSDWGALTATIPVFFAVIQNNAGDEAGSMIFDLESALRLAGALLMESEEVIESLLEEKVMSDEMLDAASEVCNTLTAALNKVSGNPHLRAGKMQPFTEARAAQLAAAIKRDDYRYNQGGRFTLVAC
jgi:hypothetical protein